MCVCYHTQIQKIDKLYMCIHSGPFTLYSKCAFRYKRETIVWYTIFCLLVHFWLHILFFPCLNGTSPFICSKRMGERNTNVTRIFTKSRTTHIQSIHNEHSEQWNLRNYTFLLIQTIQLQMRIFSRTQRISKCFFL